LLGNWMSASPPSPCLFLANSSQTARLPPELPQTNPNQFCIYVCKN
jgi:hypothetical protein